MTIEPSAQEREWRQNARAPCVSELRQQIAAAARDSSSLPAEEDLVQALQRKRAA